MDRSKLSFRYEIEKQQPRIGPGGIARGASVKEFPASIGIAGVSMRSTMAGSLIELQPGALREMHWHPNADEWQYYLAGNPKDVLATNFGVATGLINKCPQRKLFAVPDGTSIKTNS